MTEFFKKVIKFTLKWEGGYGDDPDDAGGETNFGIAKAFYPKEDIKKLTRERAIEIYSRDYWLPAYDKIMNYKIAARIFDLHVNTGRIQAARNIQRACNQLIEKYSNTEKTPAFLAVDGKFGNMSLGTVNYFINKGRSEELYAALVSQAEKIYHMIASKGNNKKFLKGWLNRLYDNIEKV